MSPDLKDATWKPRSARRSMAVVPGEDVMSGAATLGEGRADWNSVGSPRYLRASAALFVAGFATFSLLYCPQPLLPVLGRAFGIGAAASSLAISISTGLLALSIVAAASLSDLWGRKSIMVVSLLVAAALNVLSAAAPNWGLFLLARGLEGVAVGGVPAVAMTYLAEETDPGGLGLAMGLYVGGTAFGGMAGRVLTGAATSAFGWRVALGIIGAVGLGAALAVLVLLPASRHFRVRPLNLRVQATAFRAALANPRLLAVFGLAFLTVGGFVAVYNYAGFRLEAPPYGLDQTQQSLIFTLYLAGTLGSTAAGSLADRFGRGPILVLGVLIFMIGLGLTLLAPLASVIWGITFITLGFFAGHGVASGSLGGLAADAKGQAASLYLLSYYAGSSLLGTAGGWFWSSGGWPAVVGFVTTLLIVALAVAVGLTMAGSGPFPRTAA